MFIGKGATKAQFKPNTKETKHIAKQRNTQFMLANNKLKGPDKRFTKNNIATNKAKEAKFTSL